MTVNDVLTYLCAVAPLDTQEEWDNAGLLVGDKNATVNKALLALDATSAVIEEAIAVGADLIITHHPIIFHSIKNVLSDTVVGNKILKLAKNDISVISMHTNLDKTLVNDILIKKIGAFTYEDKNEFMKVGYLENEMSMKDYCSFLKSSLDNCGLRFYDSGKKVYKIACVGGAGGSELMDAYNSGCDTYITSDIAHNVWLDAQSLGINLIDADHFNTENPAIPVLCDMLNSNFECSIFSVAANNKQTDNYG